MGVAAAVAPLVATILRGSYVEVESTAIINGVLVDTPGVVDGKIRTYAIRDKEFHLLGHTVAKVKKYRQLIIDEIGATESSLTISKGMFEGNLLTKEGYQTLYRLFNNYLAKTGTSKFLKLDSEMWVNADRKPVGYIQPSPSFRIIYPAEHPNYGILAEKMIKYLPLPQLSPAAGAGDTMERFTAIVKTTASSTTSDNDRIPIDKKKKKDAWIEYCGNNVDGGKCFCCQRVISFDSFECGHIVSASHGGKDEVSNYRPTCHQCNSWSGGMSSANMYEYMLTNKTAGASQLSDDDPMVLSVKMVIFLTNYIKDKLTANPALSKTQVETIKNSLNIRQPLLHRWVILQRLLTEL